MIDRLSRCFSLLFLLVMLSGCFSTSGLSRLEIPIERRINVAASFSVLPQGTCTASIGDVLFELRRYTTGAVERTARTTPPKPFPIDARWTGTHSFAAEDGANYTVFTTPEYYGASVGVILDKEDKLATPRPLIYVSGLKKGHRIKLSAEGPFFFVPAELIESWGLRYGGRRGTDYAFEIIDKPNPTVTEIVQSIQVSEADFVAGFVVRDVRIRGTPDAENGVIRYTLGDTRASP